MPAFAQSTARIAAWNLSAEFVDHKKSKRRRIPGARLDQQVKGLELLDAEVVALVEIPAKKTLDRITTDLSSRSGISYKNIFLQQNGHLHIGVLYKDGVTAGEPTLLQGSDLGNPDHRRALVVDMEIGRFDFHLIVVHLKSGRDHPGPTIRDDQCKVIGKHIATVCEDGHNHKDILLVGDFNMIPGQDVSNFHHLGGNDLMDFLSSWDLQDRFSHIRRVGRENLLDGFAIRRTHCTEYVRGSLRLFPMHWAMQLGLGEFRRTVSDHLPFVATFRI